MIRIPQNKIGTITKIYKVYSSLEQTHERPPSTKEIADELEMSLSNVESAMKVSGKHASLDAPIRDSETASLQHVIESKEMSRPDEEVIQESLNTDIDNALQAITPRQRDVIRLYYGIGNNYPMSLSEIADIFGITRERVRQVREKGLRALRGKSNNRILRAYL